MLKEVTVKQLKGKRFYKKNKVQFVMFYGATCGPCKATLPTYEEVANFFVERGANIEFYKFNAWEPEEHLIYGGEDMNVKGVPTFLAFYEGEEVFRESGAAADKEIMHKRIHSVVDKLFKEKNIKI